MFIEKTDISNVWLVLRRWRMTTPNTYAKVSILVKRVPTNSRTIQVKMDTLPPFRKTLFGLVSYFYAIHNSKYGPIGRRRETSSSSFSIFTFIFWELVRTLLANSYYQGYKSIGFSILILQFFKKSILLQYIAQQYIDFYPWTNGVLFFILELSGR